MTAPPSLRRALEAWRANPHPEAKRYLAEGMVAYDKHGEDERIAGALRALLMLAEAAAEPEAPTRSWQCSGCRFVFPPPWQKVCPSCGREDFWSGSVDPKAPAWPGPEWQAAQKTSETPRVCRYAYGGDGGLCFSSDDVVGERCRWHR